MSNAIAMVPAAQAGDTAPSDVKPTTSGQPKVGLLAWAFLTMQFKVSYSWLGSIGWALVIMGIPRFWNARAGATDPLVRARFGDVLVVVVVLAVLAFVGGYALYRSEDAAK